MKFVLEIDEKLAFEEWTLFDDEGRDTWIAIRSRSGFTEYEVVMYGTREGRWTGETMSHEPNFEDAQVCAVALWAAREVAALSARSVN